MEFVKNQHYVPRSYLKYFADPKEQIYVFDKEKDNDFRTNIKNVASQRFFYDLPSNLMPDAAEQLEDKQIIEKFFSDIEGDFVNLLNNIRSRYVMLRNPYESEAITPDEKARLSVLLTYQYMRTKEFRMGISEGEELMMQVFTDKFASFEFDDYKPGDVTVTRNKDYDVVRHAEFMFNPETVNKFAKVFYNHIWIIGVNRTSLPLYTSDNPLVKYGHKKHNLMSNNGIGSPGIEINFPLSNHLVLIMMDREYFAELGPFYEKSK